MPRTLLHPRPGMQTTTFAGILTEMPISTILIWLVVAVIVVAVIGGAISGLILRKKRKLLEDHLKGLRGMTINHIFIGIDGKSAIALDDSLKCVCVAHNRKNIVSSRAYSHKDLVSSEIYEDGSVVTRTSRSSQLGGIATGALLMGKTGALIGGLTANTEAAQKISQIELRLTVNDMTEPIHDVAFLYFASERSAEHYKLANQEARKWHALISLLIRDADAEATATSHGTPLA